MKDIYDPNSYPMQIVVAPSCDVRRKMTVTVKNLDEILRMQRNRYEIIEYKS